MFSWSNKKISNQIGLTLIEIMLAISILVITFISILQTFPFSLSINKSAESATVASYLAQEKIEELHSLGYSAIATGTIESKHRLSTSTSSYLYNFQRETTVDFADGNIQATTTDTGMKKITTTVFYTNSISKSEKFFDLSTLISQR